MATSISCAVPEEMYAAFPDHDDAVARSQEIADSVDIDLELGKRHFPTYSPLPAGQDGRRVSARDLHAGAEGTLRRRRGDAAGRRIVAGRHGSAGSRIGRDQQAGVSQLLSDRLGLRPAGARDGHPATARGSGVGALVCYALYLSHVCPIQYDLLFERFLDESRLEAPDIDIDFCKERRADVMRYVKEKYGEDNVAQIGTFGTLAARAAIKDVGRALGIPLGRVNEVTNMVPEELGITLDKALAKERRPARDLRIRRARSASCSIWLERSKAWPATSARTPPPS